MRVDPSGPEAPLVVRWRSVAQLGALWLEVLSLEALWPGALSPAAPSAQARLSPWAPGYIGKSLRCSPSRRIPRSDLRMGIHRPSERGPAVEIGL